MERMRSPLQDLPGAVPRVIGPGAGAAVDNAQDGPADALDTAADTAAAAAHTDTAAAAARVTALDAAIAWHYGDPIVEQRVAEDQAALFDLSHRDVITVTGEDRLSWLHTLTSQALDDLPDGGTRDALLLSPKGHIEHHFTVTSIGDTVYLDTEPGRGSALRSWLEGMKFWSKVDLADADLGLLRIVGPLRTLPDGEVPEAGTAVARDGGGFVRVSPTAIEIAVPRNDLGPVAAGIVGAGIRPAGSWAADALRILRREPRFGVDSDDRTIPNETGWLAAAVHLSKGCYRGQETVARVNNLGRPPRRLVQLNLDGSTDRLPDVGSEVQTAAGRTVGRVGTVAYHHEYGPVALALVKRSLPVETPLLAGGVDALIDPDGYADHADAGADATPRSVVDRRALPDLRRR